MQENKRTLAESFSGAYDGRLRLLAEGILLVSRLEACRETALLQVLIQPHGPLTEAERTELNEATESFFRGQVRVELQIEPTQSEWKEEERKEKILALLRERQPSCAALLQRASWEWSNEELAVSVKPFAVPLLQARKTDQEILRMLQEQSIGIERVRWIPRMEAEAEEEDEPAAPPAFYAPPEPEQTPEGALPWEEDTSVNEDDRLLDKLSKEKKAAAPEKTAKEEQEKETSVVCGRPVSGYPVARWRSAMKRRGMWWSMEFCNPSTGRKSAETRRC